MANRLLQPATEKKNKQIIATMGRAPSMPHGPISYIIAANGMVVFRMATA
jgi:hypothetical protein